MMIRNGIATQNDLRKLEDLPPLSDKSADVTWISKDLFPTENQMRASTDVVEPDGSDQSQPMKGGDDNGTGKDAQVSNDQAGNG